jgi:(S)-sulfolactate dehydrogenase
MRVIAHDPAIDPNAPLWRESDVEPLALDEVFAAADVVSLHVPLVESTRHLVDARQLARMKHDAILVNTARGGIVDEAALAAALRTRRLGAAAIDVFADEPLPAGSALADAPNLLLTPHIAGVTAESNARVSTMIAERVDGLLAAGRRA